MDNPGGSQRWLAFFTFILASVLLISLAFLPWVTLIIPSWVMIINIYILVLNHRYQQDTSTRDAVTVRNTNILSSDKNNQHLVDSETL